MVPSQLDRHTYLGKKLRVLSKEYDSLAAKLLEDRGHKGLSLAHTALIFNVDEGGTKCTLVTQRAGIKRQSMAQLAADLELKNYIERLDDPDDKRAQMFVLTKLGRKYLKDALAITASLDLRFEKLLGKPATKGIRDFKDE